MINVITGTISTSGNNTIIAAPGVGYNIVISAITVQNESANATTIIVKSASTNKFRQLLQNQGDVFGRAWERGSEFELGENEALVINLSAANSCGYNVEYWIENITDV